MLIYMEKARGTFKRVWARGREAYAALAEHRYTTLAGTLVFFLLLSTVPFLFWLTLLFGKSTVLSEALSGLKIFDWASELVALLQKNAEVAGRGAGVIFLGTTLWSCTGFFYHLRRSGEIIYDYRRKKQGWKVRLSALGLTLCVLLFFAVSGTLLLAVNVLAAFLPAWISFPLRYALVLLLGFFAAWILNAYVCPYRCHPAEIALGSFLTALFWLVASAAFSLYLTFSNGEKLYGALALLVVFLLWLYWMMIGFTAGVVFNRKRIKTRDLPHKTL